MATRRTPATPAALIAEVHAAQKATIVDAMFTDEEMAKDLWKVNDEPAIEQPADQPIDEPPTPRPLADQPQFLFLAVAVAFTLVFNALLGTARLAFYGLVAARNWWVDRNTPKLSLDAYAPAFAPMPDGFTLDDDFGGELDA